VTARLCSCGCGAPAWCLGYARPCYARWARAGRPASGPPAPMSHAERTASAAAARMVKQARARGEAEPVILPPDTYDLDWLAGEPERRAERVKGAAMDLIRCVAASDAEGIRLLACKVRDWPALAVVLAECADLGRAAVVTGRPFLRSVPPEEVA
jgi:hypothetical protein